MEYIDTVFVLHVVTSSITVVRGNEKYRKLFI